LVFVTKYRRGVLDEEMLTYCEDAMRKVCGDFAASCGGAPLSIIRQYIEQQQRPA
jgi:REP element-mobilizing transposase RayT